MGNVRVSRVVLSTRLFGGGERDEGKGKKSSHDHFDSRLLLDTTCISENWGLSKSISVITSVLK